MAIPVTCSECAYRFHVELAFAGRSGRCPECDALIEVPARAEDDGEPADDFEASPLPGEFASSSRRESAPEPVRRVRREKPKFDPRPRMAKWDRVAGGFRNLAIAAGLIAIDSIVRAAFNLVNGLPDENQKFTSAQLALMAGNGLITIVSIALWMSGRIGIARSPYLPARGTVRSAAALAVLSGVPGALGMIVLVIGVMIAQNNPQGGFVSIQLGICGLGIFGLGWLVAEIVGLIAQIQILGALAATGASRLAKAQLTSLVMLICLSIIGFCGLMIALMPEIKKAQEEEQKARMARKQGNPPPFPAAKKAPPPPEAKDDNPNVNPNNPNGNNPPPPPPPPAFFQENPQMVLAITLVSVGMTVAYALLSAAAFLAAQGAVRREIERLRELSPDQLADEHERHVLRD